MSALYTRGQAAIIALALLSHTGSAAGWAMLDCLSTESFDSSVRGAAHRRIGRLGVSTRPSRRPPSTRLSPSRSQVRGAAFGLLGATGRIASITAQVVNGALITDTPLLFTVTGAFMAAGCLGALTLRPSGQRGVGCFPLQEHHAES